MFRFRLEAVHKIRSNEEEQAQLALARELTILRNHQIRLDGYGEERQTMLDTLAQEKKKKINGALMLLYMESIRAKELQIKILKTTIASQQGLVAQARERLAAAVKARKIIDAIRKRDFARYQQEERCKEQAESDEMAVLRFKNEALP